MKYMGTLQAVQTDTTQATAVIPMPAVSPLDLPIAIFQQALERRQANRVALIAWVRSALVENTDFGSIPTRRGPSKPSLWKAGAEKICGMLGVTVHFPNLPEYERAAFSGVALENIILRCELLDASGRVVADGVGARTLKQDGGDLNKALKMAEKSAMIDATLRMGGLSEVFTQDLEDMAPPAPLPPPPPPLPPPSPSSAALASDQPVPLPRPPVPLSRPPVPLPSPPELPIGAGSKLHRHLEAQIGEFGLNREGVKVWCQRQFGVGHFPELTGTQVQQLLKLLPKMAEAKARKEVAQHAETL